MDKTLKANTALWREVERTLANELCFPRTHWYDHAKQSIFARFARNGKQSIIGTVRITNGLVEEATGICAKALRWEA